LIDDLTAFDWLDDHTLIFGRYGEPTMQRINVDVDGNGAPELFHRVTSTNPLTFVARIAASPAAIAYVQVDPSMRVRMFDRNPPSVRDLDPLVQGELGWMADGSYVSVRQPTGEIERVPRDGAPTPLHAHLDGEPANATMAGSVVIVALRSVAGGRKLVAIDLATGKTVWDDPPGFSVVARCANDLTPPCFIARRTGGPSAPFELVPLDPVTGRTTGAAIFKGPVEDFAVSPDGHRVLITQGGLLLLEVNDRGDRVATTSIQDVFTIVRSVAFDSQGGILVGGSTSIGNYVIGHYDGTDFTTLGSAGGELFLLVRPSPVDGRILAIGRTMQASLWRIDRQ
jgi:hypothetical protein